MRSIGLLCVALLAGPPAVHAQWLPVGDPAEDTLRLYSLLDSARAPSFTIRPLAGARDTARVAPLPLTLRLFANSAHPWGQNDGAIWRGKGVTLALEGGFVARWRAVSLQVQPLLVYQGNAAFALAPDTVPTGFSPYGYPFHAASNGLRIDMPQRFGSAGFWTLDPGQTSLGVRGARFEVRAGTENLWWGPGRHNGIVMSNNAAGFPHLAAGTSRPVSVAVGTVELQWIWGRLAESQYFDTTAANDRRYITGMVGTFQPRPLPGLFLGATRAFVQYFPTGGLGFGDYFLVFQGITKSTQITSGNPTGDDARDQLLSLFARWAVPGSGFESYAEWARNDHNGDVRDILVEPEHSQGYTLGFQQAAALSGGRLLRFHGELTHLERPSTFNVREVPTYYVHHLVPQGYTQRGQVIGAGVGPGGNSQRFGADLFTPRGRFGVTLLRQVRDNDVIYQRYNFQNRLDSAGIFAFLKHDVTFGLEAGALVSVDRWMFGGTLALLRNYNRYYLFENDFTNVSLEMMVRRRF